MYRLDYQFTHDIDWFCKVNGSPVHLASNGGHLPQRYTIKELVSIQHKVANMQQCFRCAVNTAYLTDYLQRGEYYADLENILQEEYRAMLPERFVIPNELAELSNTLLLYSWSFIEMAKRGFWSFDRREEDGLYHLVAWPEDYDEQKFNGDVYDSMVDYRACCFPPYHDDRESDLPNSITFDINSIRY